MIMIITIIFNVKLSMLHMGQKKKKIYQHSLNLILIILYVYLEKITKI